MGRGNVSQRAVKNVIFNLFSAVSFYRILTGFISSMNKIQIVTFGIILIISLLMNLRILLNSIKFHEGLKL